MRRLLPPLRGPPSSRRKACEILLLHARLAFVRRCVVICTNLSHPSPAVILSVGATERLRETRRATVSRTRSDLAAHDVRTNTRPFLGEYGVFHFCWLTKGWFLFHAHGKVNIRRKSRQHPKRDPIVKPRRLWLCGFPRFCSVQKRVAFFHLRKTSTAFRNKVHYTVLLF